eukprot:GFKZ01006180.1.p1 GENE.GFKZ01006180.1~~GFKZ01006180.1.p1  ORF type:complete len:1218 (+),score=218.00 GFKZ01006180.1:122-3655(+)
MSQQWGALGAETTLEGASSRVWKLRFERQLAPREGSATANAASSVWLVRDTASTRLYAAKRQLLSTLDEVDALVDEAAAWRAACLADTTSTVPELVDVFVARTDLLSVTFLAEFCGRGLLPRSKPLSEAVLLTIALDLVVVADLLPSPHAHIAYESLLVDDKGRLKLAGFGAHRSAILRDNPGLNRQDDVFDVGLLLFDLVFGGQPDEKLTVPSTSSYSTRLTDIIVAALGHAMPDEVRRMAESAGADPRAPLVDVERKNEPEKALPIHVSRATQRNVERLIQGVDIGASFSALLTDINGEPEAVASAVFKVLFKEPVSKEPVCAMRILTMLHNLILDGPPSVLAALRKNDKFMEWTESSWTREAINSGRGADEVSSEVVCFAGGELAFYAAALRRKAKFHMLSAGGFTGRWDRTGALSPDGRDVLVTRRRKVIGGMADLAEMFSELGCRLATATDAQAAVKHASLGAIVSECCLCSTAAVNLAFEAESIRDAQKLEGSVERLHKAARALVFSVEHVPSAGGQQWVEQFSKEDPPDVVGNADFKERQARGDEQQDIPNDGWAEAENIVDEAREREKAEKRERKEQKKRKKLEKEAKAKAKEAKAMAKEAAQVEKEKADLTAADGALVLHGADNAAKEAVTTMFGDLLSIDDGSNNHVPIPEAPRPTPNMSNAQALAAAFGVPEDSVGGQHLALPAPGDYEDDDEGGYDNYQARQEFNQAKQSQERQVGSTAAWAARSGYSGSTLVAGEGSTKKKPHPAFYQVGEYGQEEIQTAAEEKNSLGRSEHPGNGSQVGYSDLPNAAGVYRDQSGNELFDRPEGRSYYDNDRPDSLDYEGSGARHAQPRGPAGGPTPRDSYYDDYDSYESVTYSVEDELPPPRQESRPDVASQSQFQPTSRSFSTPSRAPAATSTFILPTKLSLNLKRLRIGDRLSENGNSVVHKGEYNRETVAVKKLSKGALSSTLAVDEFTNEVKIMSILSHGALMKCVAASLRAPNYIFVTEMMKRGTLFDVLHKSRIKLTWAMIRKIAIQIAEGMVHMHSHGILHRDLKSLNIFVDGGYNVKIGDFGLSRFEHEQSDNGIAGTYQYMAPEVLRGELHSCKSDVYSFAMVLWEIVSGTPPYHGMEAREVGEKVVKEEMRPTIPVRCQQAYVNLIQMCWGTIPSRRPSFAEILELIKSTTK